MARQPSYPSDAPVGDSADSAPPAPDERATEDKPSGSSRTRHIVTGAAIGIGSAALVAALLYARRSTKGGEDGK